VIVQFLRLLRRGETIATTYMNEMKCHSFRS